MTVTETGKEIDRQYSNIVGDTTFDTTCAEYKHKDAKHSTKSSFSSCLLFTKSTRVGSFLEQLPKSRILESRFADLCK